MIVFEFPDASVPSKQSDWIVLGPIAHVRLFGLAEILSTVVVQGAHRRQFGEPSSTVSRIEHVGELFH